MAKIDPLYAVLLSKLDYQLNTAPIPTIRGSIFGHRFLPMMMIPKCIINFQKWNSFPFLSDGSSLAAKDEGEERLENRGREGPKDSLQAIVNWAILGAGYVGDLSAAAGVQAGLRLDPSARRRTGCRYMRHAEVLQAWQRA